MKYLVLLITLLTSVPLLAADIIKIPSIDGKGRILHITNCKTMYGEFNRNEVYTKEQEEKERRHKLIDQKWRDYAKSANYTFENMLAGCESLRTQGRF